MFYSHEVLTSRKYGFATVWIVATMGSSSKKVTRKAILDVDIAKTCETIATPSVPLALRLQSSLLYGVVKVHSRQCTYILHDAEAARAQMRQLFRADGVKGLNDEGKNSGRTDNLVLADDPAFLPELDFGNMVDQRIDLEQYSNLAFTNSMTQSTPFSAASSGLALGSALMLGTPCRPTSATRLSGVQNITTATLPVKPTEGLQDDLGIVFDADGDTIMHETPVRNVATPANDLIYHDMAAQPAYIDDNMVDAHQMDMYSQKQQDDAAIARRAGEDSNSTYAPEAAQDTTEVVHAQVRQQRKRQLALDSSTELRSHVLRSFQEEYVSSMTEDARRKFATTSLAVSRDNALHWLLNPFDDNDAMLDDFRGWSLISIIANLDLNGPAAQPAQSVRQPDERQLTPIIVDDDVAYLADHSGIEYGRRLPTPLDDGRPSSILPWNMSSVGRAGAQSIGSNRYGSRSRLPSLDPYSERSPGGHSGRPPSMAQLGELQPTPAQQRLEQPATESQWLRGALDDESGNFLVFVEESLDKYGGRDKVLTFAQLLPTIEHTMMTAAQALLHVLTLASKNKLAAAQTEVFGDITISRHGLGLHNEY